jgi:hypothetical protein
MGVRPPLLQILARPSRIDAANGDPSELDGGRPCSVAIC